MVGPQLADNARPRRAISLAGPSMSRSFPRPVVSLVDLLRSTLLQLEQSPGVDPQDPSFLQFKATILRSIAELELRRQDAA